MESGDETSQRTDLVHFPDEQRPESHQILEALLSDCGKDATAGSQLRNRIFIITSCSPEAFNEFAKMTCLAPTLRRKVLGS